MSQPSPESLSTVTPTRLDLAREQLRDPSLTPGEHRAAWSIVTASAVRDEGGFPDGDSNG